MKIHEYQAKELFKKFGMRVPDGEVAESPEEVGRIADEIGKPVMVKSQVHVGGRGKAGGIKYAEDAHKAWEISKEIFGMDIKGCTVRKLLVTEAVDIATEAYIGMIIDRAAKKPVIMVSPAGGIDIEQVAAETPEKIMKMHIDPMLGLQNYQAMTLASFVYPDMKVARQAADFIKKLYVTFMHVDASLAEVNPLITTTDGEMWAIDAKINIDDNGLFRRPEIEAMRDPFEEDEHETKAKDAGLSFVKLDGAIGCIVNGAGLAMATMDTVKHFGAEPANFLDIGGSSNPEKVVNAMKIILSDPNVKAILFNIFGGITRCDDVANGIVAAVKQLKPPVPIVVRLTGTNEEEGRKILEEVNLVATSSMEEVVKRAIELAA
ncbi:MAG: ADP-forming succinate--CoA ligase subunit beta [candidate division Zixibacteria bacterium]|nr:ADP-forming succinate--CoA ligase subunit beta [candidate division Zixibacteria bacterium]